jgi:DNA-directed RNA polymerase specialized sigma24 family protein
MLPQKRLEEILAVLNKDDTPGLIKQLTLHAEYHLRANGRYGETRRLGVTGADIAQDAIEKVLTGKWSWDPARSPLIPYLKTQVIPSLVINLLTLKASKLSSSTDASAMEIPADSPTPIQEMHAKQVLSKIQAHISDDQHAECVFMGRTLGLTRAQACEEFHLSTKEYDNASKRLDRKIHDLMTKEVLKDIKS